MSKTENISSSREAIAKLHQDNMIGNQLVGQKLGPYFLESIVGRGGMAAVYRAVGAHNKVYAMKVLFPPPEVERVIMARFEREARTASRLEHPSILSVLDAGQADGYAYMVMPLIDGKSLSSRLKQVGTLDEKTCIDIGQQLADALGYAHEKGVIHRDVKPSNVMLTEGDQALLADFGVARALDDPGMTQAGHLIGTPAYMAPEQARQDEEIDGRADLYSLGVMLYKMTTGRLPFRGTTLQMLHAHVYEDPPPPSDFVRLSRSMERLILKTLAKSPAQRYQTGYKMSKALEELRNQDPKDMIGGSTTGNVLREVWNSTKNWFSSHLGANISE